MIPSVQMLLQRHLQVAAASQRGGEDEFPQITLKGFQLLFTSLRHDK